LSADQPPLRADQPHLAHHFADLKQQHEASTLGMWLFLATEVLMFGSVFMAYTVYRTKYAASFAEMSGRLVWWLATANTAVLLTSSFTVVMALHSAKAGHKQLVQLFLGATLLLGLAFLGIKFYEYHVDFEERLIPGYAFHPKDWPTTTPLAPGELFMSFYFIMTGLHATHMVIGISILSWVLSRALRGRFGPNNYTAIEVFGLYWHFVDIVWIFLFPLLYLVRA
jgi:cytochrome c oxidase subunit 3